MDATFWDERYGQEAYAYGEEPNKYLVEQLKGMAPGKILFPADGEGRNSVYAATLGWQAYAFDQSVEGQRKALQLAAKRGVHIDYQAGEFAEIKYEEASFDAMALIFAHFGGAQKMGYLKQLNKYIKPGGIVIFEAYSKSHLRYKLANPKVGGPGDEAVLYSIAEVAAVFPDYDIIQLEEMDIEIWEGQLHGGLSSVVRFTGRKR